MPIWPDDWAALFLPQAPIVESVIRASAIYLFVFVLFRVLLRRESGGLGISDMLVIILIAAATHASMAGHAWSVTDAFILVGTLVVWDWALSFLAYHHALFFRFVRPRPVPIIRDGRVLRDNLRRELLSRAELEEHLRLRGIQSPADVAEAYMEPDGEISVIPKRSEPDDPLEHYKPPRSPELKR